MKSCGSPLTLAAIGVLSAGCHSTALPGCVCTTLFAIIQVTVVDTTAAPLAGLSPAITLLRTSQSIVPDQTGVGGGRYNVITDGEHSLIRPSGDTLRFVVTAGARSARADFAVDEPGSCACHVNKVSGPDTLVLR